MKTPPRSPTPHSSSSLPVDALRKGKGKNSSLSASSPIAASHCLRTWFGQGRVHMPGPNQVVSTQGRAPRPPRDQYTVLQPPFNHNHISYKFVQHRERQITTWYFNFWCRIKKIMCLRCVASWKGGRSRFHLTFCMAGGPIQIPSKNRLHCSL